jgi:hypothetical protein
VQEKNNGQKRIEGKEEQDWVFRLSDREKERERKRCGWKWRGEKWSGLLSRMEPRRATTTWTDRLGIARAVAAAMVIGVTGPDGGCSNRAGSSLLAS